jgi:hypothetical protein
MPASGVLSAGAEKRIDFPRNRFEAFLSHQRLDATSQGAILLLRLNVPINAARQFKIAKQPIAAYPIAGPNDRR